MRYIDPDGRCAKDVHYYLTFYIASQAGFSFEDALRIAEANNGVDLNPETQPFHSSSARKEWHFPVERMNGQESVRRNSLAARRKLNEAIINPDSTVDELGMAMHVLQDSFGHEGFGPILGHASAGHRPDLVYLDPEKTREMIKATYYALLDYQRARGIIVEDRWPEIEDDLMRTADEFSRLFNDHDERGFDE